MRCARWSRTWWRIVVVGALLLPLRDAQTQDRTFDGRISRALPDGRPAPLPGAWVILHRVGADAAAPLDSMRTRANGAYAFRYRATGDTNAVYFVSTTRGGVAYFTPPTRESVISGGTADLVVFDTTSAALPITLRGRHLIVTAPDPEAGSTRTVIEVYELSNDSTLTRVPGADGAPTFEAPLPAGVREVMGGQGDISPEAIRVQDGRVAIVAPLAPGLKQFSFSYDLPASELSLAVTVDRDIPVMEVLIEDPRGIATGGTLTEVDPVQVDGRPFKRFLAENLTAPSVVQVTIAPAEWDATSTRRSVIIAGIGAVMLVTLAGVLVRRGTTRMRPPAVPVAERLAREIAGLDLAFEAIADPSDEQRVEYRLARAALKEQLRGALAKHGGVT